MKPGRLLAPAVGLSLLLSQACGGQYLPRTGGSRLPSENRLDPNLKIKRKTVSGTVKAVDSEKKTLIVASGKSDKAADVPVDVGPSLIKAGKGGATLVDIKVGDKIRVWGEVTVQGGLRAMEITLPKERMSIPPVVKKKDVKSKEEKKPAG